MLKFKSKKFFLFILIVLENNMDSPLNSKKIKYSSVEHIINKTTSV